MDVEQLEIYVLAEEHASGMFWAQHGISFLLKVRIDGTTYKLLFDTGNSWEPIKHNLSLLGEDLNGLVGVVLSHRHYDHTGGLKGFLKELNKEVPIISHPDLFKPNFVLPFRDIGIPYRRRELEELGGKFILSRDPIEILPGIVTTGEVPRISELESKMTIDTYTLENGKLIKDPLMDDSSLIVKMDDGSVILTGCSHAGIINILKHTINLAGPIKAVIGGFHLISADKERIEGTVRAFKELDIKEVYTGHCTGITAECAFRNEYGERFRQMAVGKIYRFS